LKAWIFFSAFCIFVLLGLLLSIIKTKVFLSRHIFTIWVLILCVCMSNLQVFAPLYRGVKDTLESYQHNKESFETCWKSSMIFCLIWLLSYEGSISNAFLVWRNISAGRVVILVLLQRHWQSNGGSGCTVRTIVLCQRSW